MKQPQTPLDEFIERLSLRSQSSDLVPISYPRHVHASEDNCASDKGFKRDTKRDEGVTCPDSPPQRAMLVEALRQALGLLYAMTTREADGNAPVPQEARELHSEIRRLFDDVGPCVAQGIHQQEAKAYHQRTRRCPTCGQAGIFHPPASERTMLGCLLKMPLDRFERDGQPVEVRVPWVTTTLWFVPTAGDAEPLGREGISRGRIWTADELTDLLTISGLTADQVQTIALTKLKFGGDIVEVRSRRKE